MKRDAAFLEQLHQEIPRRNLTPQATERIEKTYQMLGPQYEPCVKKRSHKALWVTATVFALCCVMLCEVNTILPAVAENLPGVGHFFRQVNQAFQTASGSKSPHGTNLDTYEVQDVNIIAQSGDSTLKIMQAFSDGERVCFTVKVLLPQSLTEQYEYLFFPDSFSLSVNGESLPETGSPVLFQQKDEAFVGTVVASLPEHKEQGDALQIDLSIPSLMGKESSTKDTSSQLDANWEVSFSVTVDTSSNYNFSVDTASDNGMKLLEIQAIPTEISCKVTLPAWGTTEFHLAKGEPVLYTPDGNEIPFDLSKSTDEGGYNPWDSVEQTCTLYFDGAPAGTKQVILRIYEDSQQESVLAEYTIDLEQATASPTTTYDDGGALDLDYPFRYQYLSWYAKSDLFGNLNPKFVNGLFPAAVSFSRGGGSWEVSLLTENDYREILVELYNCDGDLIGSTVSQYGTKYGQDNWFWDESSPFWGEKLAHYPYYSYRVYLDPTDNYLPAFEEVLTLVVKDHATGEELIRQEITMDQRDFS